MPTTQPLALILSPSDVATLRQAIAETACTHNGCTREHIETCCADGFECDRCGTLIPLNVIDPLTHPVDEAALCTDCQNEVEL